MSEERAISKQRENLERRIVCGSAVCFHRGSIVAQVLVNALKALGESLRVL